MPPPAVTQARLNDYEPKVKEAIKGTHFEYERRENVLVITAPVQGAFNPDRPNMMLPAMLGPLTRMAKMVEADETIGVLILGHADSSGDAKQNQILSEQRARAFTSIFRMSGLKQNRLTARGLGSVSPRAANDSPQGRALNRRVEIMLTSKDTLNALIARYSQPAPASTSAAVADVKKVTDKNAKTVAKAEKSATRN
ncbi:OmpA family protein [Ectopseudomonas mendocina]|uniref:OmpA family protein n=1 Tax=Ectopseudomonas mendocina TaxID=300 RepID=A0ABZ2RB41_ECTME